MGCDQFSILSVVFTYSGAKSGCHLKTKLATSVSTTNLAVVFGGDVSAALLIDEADEGFGYFCWSRIDVTQQPIQIERAGPDQIGRIFDGLWWYTVHVVYSSASVLAKDGDDVLESLGQKTKQHAEVQKLSRAGNLLDWAFSGIRIRRASAGIGLLRLSS